MTNDFFVGRSLELRRFNEILNDFNEKGGLYVIHVWGSGGIGKTKLLKEMWKTYCVRHSLDPRITKINLIDMYESDHHRTSGVEYSIAQLLGLDYFAEYTTAYNDYNAKRRKGVDVEQLHVAREKMHHVFNECFAKLSQTKCIVLLFDTFEVIEKGDVGQWFVCEFLSAIKEANAVIIVAGRHETNLGQLPEQTSVEAIELKPFEGKGTIAYFEQRGLADFDDIPRIHTLTRGRPVLVALSCDWIQERAGFLDISFLHTWTPQEFEGVLVRKIKDLQAPEDQAILLMAHIHRRFDQEVLAFLTKMPKDKSREVIENLARFSFVKYRPLTGSCLLHDEMQILVEKYIWSEIDKVRDERRRLSEDILAYYDMKIKEKTREMEETEDIERLQILKGEQQVLVAERLFYELAADLDNGFQRFVSLFNRAITTYQLGFCELLLSEVSRFQTAYSVEKRYESAIPRANWLMVSGRFHEARERLTGMLKDYGDDDAREVEMLIQLGNCAIRLGDMSEAVQYFEEGLEICERKELKEWIGKAENALGWVNRLMGRWDKAAEYYNLSLGHGKDIGDDIQIAYALNNLGYVRALQGNYSSAIMLCNQALLTREAQGRFRDIGGSHSTLGEIYRHKRDYEKALQHYEKALRIFENQDDKEWMATVYQQQGFAKWFSGKPQKAWKDLQKGVELCREYNRRELPGALHRAGHVAEKIYGIDKAEELFKESYERSKESLDVWFIFENLVGFAELDYIRWEKERKQEYADRIAGYLKELEEFEERGYDFPPLSGRMKRTLGNVAYDQKEYEKACKYYQDAYPLIAKWYYGLYRLPEELDSFGERIDRLPPSIALEWCDALSRYWTELGLDKEHPEMIDFCTVHRIKAKLRSS